MVERFPEYELQKRVFICWLNSFDIFYPPIYKVIATNVKWFGRFKCWQNV